MGGYNENITAYLRGSLPAEEKAALEAELKNSPDLRKELARHRILELAIDQLAEKELRSHLKVPPLESKLKVVSAPRRRWLPALAAAAGIVLLAFAGMYGWSLSNYSGQAIAEDIYIAPITNSNRSAGATVDTEFAAAQNAFAQGDLETTIQYAQEVQSGSPQYIDARFMLAHAYFQQDDFGLATTVFQQLENSATLPGYINRDELKANRLLSELGRDNGLSPEKRIELEELLALINPKGKESLDKKLNSNWRKLAD